MEETKQTSWTGESDRENGADRDTTMDQRQQQLVDMGSATITTGRGTIHTLTIVGQVEGHQILPPNTKSTKYEHVMPLLATIEESEEIDGRRTFHRRASGRVRQDLLYRPVGRDDHPSGAHERIGHRRCADLQLFSANSGAHHPVCYTQQ